jgi:hypothetical protein
MTNPALVAIFRALLPRFGRHGQADPWWWPKGPGTVPEDWGLTNLPASVIESLRAGARKDTRSATPRYSGFAGSVAAEEGCAWLVSIRPSRGSFQASVGPLYTALANRSPNASVLIEVHVTDLIKFRGPTRATECFAEIDEPMLQTSIDCLAAEYLSAKPSRILLVDLASKALTNPNSRWRPRTAIRRQSGRCSRPELPAGATLF